MTMPVVSGVVEKKISGGTQIQKLMPPQVVLSRSQPTVLIGQIKGLGAGRLFNKSTKSSYQERRQKSQEIDVRRVYI